MYQPPFEVKCIECSFSKATHFHSGYNKLGIGRCRDCYEHMMREIGNPGFRLKRDGRHYYPDDFDGICTAKSFDKAELDAFYKRYERRLYY